MAQQNNRARQRQRQRIIIILMLVVLAAGAFFLFSGKEEPKKKAKRPEPAGMVKVPSLKIDVKPGTRLTKRHIRFLYRSPRNVPTDAVLSQDQYIGRFTTTPILQGQYISEGDVSANGAVGRYSAMTKPGMRLVVLNARLFPSGVNTLRAGDHIDILALQGSKVSARRKKGPKRNSGAVDGSQPGNAGNTKKRSGRKSVSSSTLKDPGTLSATLVAENAEVMSVPKTRRGKNISGHNALVLQMAPQDAHITTLMAASGTQLRVVFRPYGDDTRLTQPKEVSVTTRLPKPLPDPDVVNLIVNGQTYLSKPNSQMFDRPSNNSQQTDNTTNVIYGREKVRTSNNQENNEPDNMALQEFSIDE